MSIRGFQCSCKDMPSPKGKKDGVTWECRNCGQWWEKATKGRKEGWNRR